MERRERRHLSYASTYPHFDHTIDVKPVTLCGGALRTPRRGRGRAREFRLAVDRGGRWPWHAGDARGACGGRPIHASLGLVAGHSVG